MEENTFYLRYMSMILASIYDAIDMYIKLTLHIRQVRPGSQIFSFYMDPKELCRSSILRNPLGILAPSIVIAALSSCLWIFSLESFNLPSGRFHRSLCVCV